MGWGIAAAAAASLAGAALTSSAASGAAKTQASAAQHAADLQYQTGQQIRSDLLPYNTAGVNNIPTLFNQYKTTQSDLGNAFNNSQASADKIGIFNQAQLEQNPGYAFNVSQGQKFLGDLAAGKGWKGNLIRSGLNYASGLAANNTQNYVGNQVSQFNAQNQQFSNAYNKANAVYNQLLGPTSLGENAAAQSGNATTAAAANAGSNIAGAGQALGAGQVAGANQIANGLNSAAGLGLYSAMQNNQNNSQGSYADASKASAQLGPVNNSDIFAPSYGYGGVTPSP